MMTDQEFCERLLELDAKGAEGLPEMREILRNGNMHRVIVLAAKGAGVKPKKPPPPAKAPAEPPSPKPKPVPAEANGRRTKIADGFPGAEQKLEAVQFWQTHGRPDLAGAAEDQGQQFRDHHIGEGKTMVDWGAAWRTWTRNALRFNKPQRGGDLHAVPGAYEPTTAAGWMDRMAVFLNGSGADVPKGFWSPKYGPRPGEPGCKVPGAVLKAIEQRRTG